MIARCRDTQTTVTLLSVDLLSQAQPPVVTIGLSNDTAPDGPGSEPYRTNLLTNDPTVNGIVADAEGLVRLEAQIDDGPLLDPIPFTGPRRTTLILESARPAAPCATVGYAWHGVQLVGCKSPVRERTSSKRQYTHCDLGQQSTR